VTPRLALGVALLALAMPAAAQAQSNCFGELSADTVEQKPGPNLRFGITPGVQTGQLVTGAQPPRTPEDPARQLDALARLRADGAPFVLRLHRFFWSDGDEAIARFTELTERYTSAGYLVEFQLRYHPDEQQEGDIAAWTEFVRRVVRHFGPNPRIVAIQVTNEVNLTFSPDSSDGAYRGARDALIQGVIAAQEERRRRGFAQLGIGFNWAYRGDPDNERRFWEYLRDNGGPSFVSALDWVGVDAYPGTFFPPAQTESGGERDSMVNAFSTFRCLAAIPGIPETVPIHIEENGYPTGPNRSQERQVEAMNAMIGAAHDFRGTYNISDYRWFNLRDGDSTSPNPQVQYGLMTDDYGEKLGFGRYRDLVAQLGRRHSTERPRLRLSVRCEGKKPRGTLGGADLPAVERADFYVNRRRVASDSRAPFRRTLGLKNLPRKRAYRARVKTSLVDGRKATVRRPFRPCRASRRTLRR
jgi:hypothetical protein